jgi:hypothetical protein
MIEHPIATQLAAQKACQSRVWTYTVAVVNSIRDVDVDKRMDGEGAASGSACKWGKHHLILTANHVIHKDAKPSDLRLFWRPYAEDLYLADKDLKPEHIVDAVAIKDPHAAIHRCGWEDLAIITIDPSEAGPHSEFIDVGTESVDPAVNEWINVCGFPYDKRIRIDDRMVTEHRREVKNALRPEIFSGQVLPGPDFPTKDFVADRHYLVPYIHKTSNYPGGFSGAAAWWESDKPLQVWRPNFKFAGVCTHCYKHRNPILERIVKASTVQKFLQEALGNPVP